MAQYTDWVPAIAVGDIVQCVVADAGVTVGDIGRVTAVSPGGNARDPNCVVNAEWEAYGGAQALPYFAKSGDTMQQSCVKIEKYAAPIYVTVGDRIYVDGISSTVLSAAQAGYTTNLTVRKDTMSGEISFYQAEPWRTIAFVTDTYRAEAASALPELESEQADAQPVYNAALGLARTGSDLVSPVRDDYEAYNNATALQAELDQLNADIASTQDEIDTYGDADDIDWAEVMATVITTKRAYIQLTHAIEHFNDVVDAAAIDVSLGSQVRSARETLAQLETELTALRQAYGSTKSMISAMEAVQTTLQTLTTEVAGYSTILEAEVT